MYSKCAAAKLLFSYLRSPSQQFKGCKALRRMPRQQEQQQAKTSMKATKDKVPEESEEAPAVKQEPMVKKERIPEGEAQRMLQSLKRLAADGDPGPLQAYKKRTTQEGKREFYWDVFKLDRKCSKFSVTESKSVSHEEAIESLPDWYTADQVAEFEGYRSHLPNYKELKEAAVAGLPSKPHPKASLNDMGERLYWYVHVITRNTDLQKRKLEGIQSASDLSALDYDLAMQTVPGELVDAPSSSSNPSKVVEIQPWKAKALEVVKKAQALGSSVSRVVHQAQEAIAKLELVSDRATSATTKALAQSLHAELVPKVQLVQSGLTEFQKHLAAVTHNSKEAAANLEEVLATASTAMIDVRDAFSKVFAAIKPVINSMQV